MNQKCSDAKAAITVHRNFKAIPRNPIRSLNKWKTKLETRLMEFCRKWILNHLRLRHLDMSPRRWSNSELRRIAAIVEGDIINISGWKDGDKEGGVYRSYFTKARSYTISNYYGSREADDGATGSIFLDLSKPLPEELNSKYDLAFCHTIMEHIFDTSTAISNIACLTRDLIILVVPFMQDEHYTAELYGDYWRFTPLGLKLILENCKLSIVYMNSNDSPWYPIYICCVASKNPELWRGRFGSGYDWNSRIGRTAFHYPNCVW
jgi:hypothetical protein